MKTPCNLLSALALTLAIATIYSATTKEARSPQMLVSQTVQAATLADKNPWENLLGKVVVPKGWEIKPCEGEAPFLCVSSNQRSLGSVELNIYPLTQQTAFQRMLAQVGVPAGASDYGEAIHQSQVLVALQTWVDEHYTVIGKDRQGIYGQGGKFQPWKPAVAQVGQLKGLLYGFKGRDRTGKVQEYQIGYVAFDGKQLYVITTALDLEGLPGGFKSWQHLQQFEPYLTRIVAGLRLPVHQMPALP
ncbi:MAG: hypothetical protein K6T90_09310 [Leptolyngbyaceae cyanobacterium HOT.MB2.61]|jgi:hypothetical protein|nr:hypothetical protein [Leptolyngbyaceae cyanobacterium HOT.MB2.61]